MISIAGGEIQSGGPQAVFDWIDMSLWKAKDPAMAELVLTDADDAVLHQLQERAARHGRTPDQEAKAILTESVGGKHPDAWAPVDAIYERLAASGRTFSDSAELLRDQRSSP